LISSNTLVNNAEVEKVVDPYCKDGASISIGNSQMLEIPSVVDQVSSNSLRSTLSMNQSSANNSSISKSKPSEMSSSYRYSQMMDLYGLNYFKSNLESVSLNEYVVNEKDNQTQIMVRNLNYPYHFYLSNLI